MKESEAPEIGKIIDIDSRRPHLVSEVVCLKCLNRWIDVRPEGTPLKALECPSCGMIGYVIETGEVMDADDYG